MTAECEESRADRRSIPEFFLKSLRSENPNLNEVHQRSVYVKRRHELLAVSFEIRENSGSELSRSRDEEHRVVHFVGALNGVTDLKTIFHGKPEKKLASNPLSREK